MTTTGPTTTKRAPESRAAAITISTLLAHADKAAVLVAAAYDQSPLGQWLVEDPHARHRVLRGWLGMRIEQAFAHGWVDVAIDDGGEWAGIGVWHHRTGTIAPPPCYADRLGRIAGPHQQRFLDLDAALAERTPAVDHHVLVAAAGWPGSGTEAALVAAGLERADAAGRSVFAMVPAATDTGPFQQWGFEPQQSVCLPDGPTLQPLLRPATTGKPQRRR